MGLSLKLEASVGSSIEDCFKQAHDIACRLDLLVEFYFNGVTCMVKKLSNPDLGPAKYDEALYSKYTHKFAVI